MDRLPGAVKLAADSMGVGTDELMKMMEANQLAADKFLPLFSVALRESVREGGALEKMMQGTAAQMGRFGNSVNDAALAFSRGGFNKALTDFLERATKTMDALTKSGFFDTLGFAFRMLVAPINAVMEVVGGLADIFSRARDEGGEYANTVKWIAAAIGLLLLPALLAVGKALAPFLLAIAGLIALGDIMQGLAGNSSEFKTNMDAFLKSLKEGNPDWEAFSKIAGQVAISMAGIAASVLTIMKFNPLGKKNKGGSDGTIDTGDTKKKGGILSKAGKVAGNLGKALIIPATIATLVPEETKASFGQWVMSLFSSGESSGGQRKPNAFDRNAEMIAKSKRIQGSYANIPSTNQTPTVLISNMNINGDSAPEGLRTNVEDYMNSVFDDVFKDAMRETIR